MPKDESKLALIFLVLAIFLLPTLDPTDLLTIPLYQQYGSAVFVYGLLFLGLYFLLRRK